MEQITVTIIYHQHRIINIKSNMLKQIKIPNELVTKATVQVWYQQLLRMGLRWRIVG